VVAALRDISLIKFNQLVLINQNMEGFLSCDWGTSSFRLKLIEANSFRIIASETSSQGIAQTFEFWKQSNQEEEKKIPFYTNCIWNYIKAMEQKLHIAMDHLPVILSGMASSNMGMLELPYKELPFATDCSDILATHIKATGSFPHNILLISGARTSSDVMRGEETQLVGCNCTGEKRIYIFPGTHSKHVYTEYGNAIDCKTYMTGEFFELLSAKSILSSAVTEGKDIMFENNLLSFEKGINDGTHFNLLNSSFQVRTNSLFDKLSKQENYYYLSGLLIGTELKDFLRNSFANITMVCNREQWAYYREAFRVLGKNGTFPVPAFQDVEEATIRGQWNIYKRIS